MYFCSFFLHWTFVKEDFPFFFHICSGNCQTQLLRAYLRTVQNGTFSKFFFENIFFVEDETFTYLAVFSKIHNTINTINVGKSWRLTQSTTGQYKAKEISLLTPTFFMHAAVSIWIVCQVLFTRWLLLLASEVRNFPSIGI